MNHPLQWVIAMLIAVSPWPAFSQAHERIVVSAPGPRNFSYLPLDLIPKIGADREEGIALQILHVGGGAVALNDVMVRNADFAMAGLPAVMSLRAHGGDAVAIAAVNGAPLFVLMVRSDLRSKVKRIADLKGRTIGVTTSTKNSKTTSQQFAELLLASDGVDADAVRMVPAGQSWVEQSSLMLSGTADAVMGAEPFASRLLAGNKVFFLASLADPETAKRIPGANFHHAVLATRGEIVANEPKKAAKMVRVLARSLRWIAAHKPEEIVDKLGIADPEERGALLTSLRKYPHAYSDDGRFSTSQLKETEVFFRATSPGNPAAQSLRVESTVNDRWAGRSK